MCGQGRLLLAITNSRPNNFFILCEDCESEWNSAEDAAYIEIATIGGFGMKYPYGADSVPRLIGVLK